MANPQPPATPRTQLPALGWRRFPMDFMQQVAQRPPQPLDSMCPVYNANAREALDEQKVGQLTSRSLLNHEANVDPVSAHCSACCSAYGMAGSSHQFKGQKHGVLQECSPRMWQTWHGKHIICYMQNLLLDVEGLLPIRLPIPASN